MKKLTIKDSDALILVNIEEVEQKTCANINLFLDNTSRKVSQYLKANYPILKGYDDPFTQYRIKADN